MLKSSFSSSEQNSQKVALELQELKKKLRDQKRATDIAEANARRCQQVLGRSKLALSGVLEDIKDTMTPDTPVKSEPKEIKTENGE